MPGSDELYPPAQYGWGWMLLAFGILALLIAGAWLLIVLTRPRRALSFADENAGQAPLVIDVLSQLRTEYLTRIQQIETDYTERRLSARQANLELSRVVRTFVNEYSGLEAPVLALDDLVARGVHPALVDALGRHYYPSIFRPGPVIDPVAGAEAARTVVRTWH
ncbi:MULTISPECIES: hypothetical protein [unclassified Microbacterium]|jgi:hypothetical protein|uniref:hypothetical protein n=1 Tax=unclassified Microbacterium TaxID=2609290 RepID=UPI000CFA8D76|nr:MULTISPECIES: hypothetical protein [unclassified Microbacterium]PQZ55686.1 hypothetical protein CQ032_11200 [Microbacterium sp. MYb43]PQZ81018.1 hypothetical protein CQ031_06860 [Microbacterium sp. MYb40]PRB20850.1 hypothetical protein CQ040_10980 [Microbacterium sp. MYb54]PRB31911.1 hypothetical protein CQ037_00645 [Microbacterium sp. MYb50]PRB64473.1 hypothetical protein CQ021_13785 [Microbacterium sp. MYb24]